jgi:hypothetical protein
MARSWLLDPQAADRPGDHELLDLLGALEDVVGLLNPFGSSSGRPVRVVCDETAVGRAPPDLGQAA